jgi:hypothetical protein
MRAGLTAGALTAIVAVLVSLPLHSPLDNVFNSATVAIATLVLGFAAGLLWGRPRGGLVLYAGALSAALAVTIAVMVVGSLWLDRLASFGIPLAVIAFAGAGALTPVAARLAPARWATLLAAIAVVAALALGIGLAGQGDAPSGKLTIPPRSGVPAP